MNGEIINSEYPQWRNVIPKTDGIHTGTRVIIPAED